MSTNSTAETTEKVDGNTTYAALAHASALVASFLGPLLFLILAENDDELVKRNAKNALNFQILIFIGFMISGFLTIILVGFLLFPIIAIIDLVLVIRATLKANDGEVYSYPYTPQIL